MKEQTFYKIDEDRNERLKLRRSLGFFDRPSYENCMVVYSRETYEIFSNRGYDLGHYSNSDLVPVELRRLMNCKEQAKYVSSPGNDYEDGQDGYNSPRVLVC